MRNLGAPPSAMPLPLNQPCDTTASINVKWRQIPSDSADEADRKNSRLLSTTGRQSVNREFDDCETSLASALAARS